MQGAEREQESVFKQASHSVFLLFKYLLPSLTFCGEILPQRMRMLCDV